MSLNLIRASDGTGEAVRASVTAIRAPGSTTINVDAVTNWPDTFVATTGDLLASGALDPATVLVFKGSLSGATIVIDTIAPGYTDNGSAVSNVVILKPSTFWADNIRDTLAVSLDDDGTLKAGAVDNAAALANNVVTTAKILDANVPNAKLATGSGEPGGEWTAYTPTLSGYSGTPTIVGRWTQVGKTVTVTVSISGTSNATTKYFTYPVAPATWQDGIRFALFNTSNGTTTMVGAATHRTSTPNIEVYRGFNQGTATSTLTGWTASGTAEYSATFTYQAA